MSLEDVDRMIMNCSAIESPNSYGRDGTVGSSVKDSFSRVSSICRLLSRKRKSMDEPSMLQVERPSFSSTERYAQPRRDLEAWIVLQSKK